MLPYAMWFVLAKQQVIAVNGRFRLAEGSERSA